MRAKFGRDPTAGSKKVTFKFISRLGVRSLANASRARQFNPLNLPGVGWVPLPQTKQVWQPWSAGRACAVVRGRSCVVVRGRSCAVDRVVVPFCPLRGQHCRGTNEQHLITH